MGDSESMNSIEVRAGTVTITEENIHIDIGPFKGVKRIYEQSKLLFSFLIGGLLLMVVVFILDSSPFRRTLSQFVLIFAIAIFTFSFIFHRLRDNIKTASEIRRTTVDRVEYTTGSQVFPPKLRIIVSDGVVTDGRPVRLSHRRLGGDQQLEDAIQAFEDAGITIVPADGAADEDS